MPLTTHDVYRIPQIETGLVVKKVYRSTVYNLALICLVPASSSANASAYNWSSSFLYFLAVGGRLSFRLLDGLDYSVFQNKKRIFEHIRSTMGRRWEEAKEGGDTYVGVNNSLSIVNGSSIK